MSSGMSRLRGFPLMLSVIMAFLSPLLQGQGCITPQARRRIYWTKVSGSARCSRRKRLARLFVDHVLGIPVRPAHGIVLAGLFLVLAVRGRRAPECGSKLAGRSERRDVRVAASG